MARKRMIDPSFWRDEKVAQCSFMERLLFEGLWTFAEDHGAGRANPLLIKADIFPYDPLREADLQKSLEKLSSLDLILLYEIDGQKYYYIYNFLKHQVINKPSKTTIPLPLKEHYHTTTTPLPSQEKLKEEKLKEDKRNICAFFEQLWNLYPVKKGKGSISDTQKQKLYKIGLDEMTRAIERYIAEQQKLGTDIKYYKHGSTFFNSGYVDYLDDNYKPLPKTKKGNNNFEEREDIDFDEFEAEALKRRLNNG